jgi:hypothetical protein
VNISDLKLDLKNIRGSSLKAEIHFLLHILSFE